MWRRKNEIIWTDKRFADFQEDYGFSGLLLVECNLNGSPSPDKGWSIVWNAEKCEAKIYK